MIALTVDWPGARASLLLALFTVALPACRQQPAPRADVATGAQSDEPNDDIDQVTANDAATSVDEELSPEEIAARYVVPSGGISQLEQFIDRIRSYDPVDTNDLLAHERHSPSALLTAARRILEQHPDKSSSAYRKAAMVDLQHRLTSLATASDGDKQQMFEELSALLEAKQHERRLESNDLVMALSVAEGLESVDTKLAAAAYRRFGEMFVGSDDQEMAEMAEMMTGAARRWSLPGQIVKLTGTAMDGTPFDVASLRGRVVLVDFWATWCAPCVAEHARIRQVYQRYHDQGLEVVGVSLDVDRQELERYLRDERIPWMTLHEPERTVQNPAVKHYGILSIPAMFLLDRTGKVLSVTARGAELDRLLDDQFPAAAGDALGVPR